jgi:hypothetical protein
MAAKANLKLIGSNYLGDLAAGIREDHDAVEHAKGAGLKHAIAAGKKLIEAKKTIKQERGSWIEWVKDKCKFSHSTANGYMRVAKIRNPVANLTYKDAIKQTVKTPRKKKEEGPPVKLAVLRKRYVTSTTILTIAERRKELIHLAHAMGFDIDIKGEPVAVHLSVPGFKKE